VTGQAIGEEPGRTATVPHARARADAPAAAVPQAPSPRPEPAEEGVPTAQRLVGLCTWAALVGFLGVAVGVRGLLAIIVKAPHWYEPSLVALGLGGIALTVVAFLTVHHRVVPWLFLTLSSGVLLTAIVATAKAT
jgi:hypothetical protein